MTKKLIGVLALIFFLIITIGLLWLATQSDNSVSVTLAFAAGLSMIFLPCTLPLALVIVPLAAKEKKPSRAIGIATAFGLGLATTLALYGIVIAFLGAYFGLDSFTRVMFVVAGSMALLFALSELGLMRVPLPEFTSRIPNWITKGYGKSYLLGLFLGNAGIGCPNPAFYVLLTYIASTGSVVAGGWLGLVHGLGRAAPLIFLVLLAILGIQSVKWITKASKNLHIWSGVGLVIAGSFILTYGLFGMKWWETSVFHTAWNKFIFDIAPNLAELQNHSVAQGVFEGSPLMGWASLLLLILVPFVWYKKKKRAITEMKGGACCNNEEKGEHHHEINHD